MSQNIEPLKVDNYSISLKWSSGKKEKLREQDIAYLDNAITEVKIKRENLKRETRWTRGLAVVDLAALSRVAALGWLEGASRMVAGH
jgi:hypothetical protein